MSASSEINTNLRLDRVVSSQPELGPSIPDGGYGWFIFIASLFLQLFIPSILISYGIFMLYWRLESSLYSDDPKLSDIAQFPTPVIFLALWTLADPCSRIIVHSSTWPKLLACCGIFLTCSGLLIQWVAVRNMSGFFLYALAGFFSGFGASLTLTQSEILLNQYFKKKLQTINNILTCVNSLGFIIIPIILGLIISHTGTLHGLLIYQTIIMQCVIVVLVFKKPIYLKTLSQRYKLLKNLAEEDEMIFTTETPSGSNSQTPRQYLNESFSQDFAQDLGPFSEDPKPIYSETNNISDIFSVPEPSANTPKSLKQQYYFLRKFAFYKSLFYFISAKYSMIVYWILFPTYLYVELDKLQIQQTTFIIGALGLASLLIALFLSLFPLYEKKQQLLTATFCFLSSVGYFVISDVTTKNLMLFGALLVTTSLTVFHAVTPSVTKYILKGDNTEKTNGCLHLSAGLSIMLFLITDFSYRMCFRIISVIQLLSGFLLILSFIKNIFYR